VPTEAA